MSAPVRKMNKQDERKAIMAVARKASLTAVRISTAMGLSIQKVRGRAIIIIQNADGSMEEIKHVQVVKSLIKLTKGTKLSLQQKK